ncbi:hypothetical protein ACH4UM_40620, partial [Streptomyces sp. NPDC020801]
YQARLRSRFGRAWRRKAPVESLMPLRLARYGVPLAETAPSGLAAAGIEPALIPPAPQPGTTGTTAGGRTAVAAPVQQQAAYAAGQRPQLVADQGPGEPPPYEEQLPPDDQSPWFQAPQQVDYHGGYDPTYNPEPPYEEWYEEQQPSPEETGSFPIPVGPNRTRELGEGGGTPEPDEEAYYQVFRQSINGSLPTPRQFADGVEATYGVPLPENEAKRMVNRFSNRFNAELEEDHIA